jgi:hypothetical protein
MRAYSRWPLAVNHLPFSDDKFDRLVIRELLREQVGIRAGIRILQNFNGTHSAGSVVAKTLADEATPHIVGTNA